MHLRKCSRCERTLDISQFYKHGFFNCRQRYRAMCKKCRAKYERSVAFRLMMKEYRKIITAVRSKVASGKIKKSPCVLCGEEKVEAHHEDYNKPLEVTWLCKEHHTLRHRDKQKSILPIPAG